MHHNKIKGVLTYVYCILAKRVNRNHGNNYMIIEELDCLKDLYLYIKNLCQKRLIINYYNITLSEDELFEVYDVISLIKKVEKFEYEIMTDDLETSTLEILEFFRKVLNEFELLLAY